MLYATPILTDYLNSQLTFIGPAGPSGAPGIASALLAFFYQNGSPITATGRVLTTYINTFTASASASANAQCSVICNTQAYNFFGTVNTNLSTPSVDCYCGNTLNYVTVIGLGSGMAPDNNCSPCNGGPKPPGDCGVATSNTVAIYARAFQGLEFRERRRTSFFSLSLMSLIAVGAL